MHDVVWAPSTIVFDAPFTLLNVIALVNSMGIVSVYIPLLTHTVVPFAPTSTAAWILVAAVAQFVYGCT
ncbi:MAG TPA: hypothetical protein DCZ95_13650 [Verrucomicrobia bacterium]|nr:MAG: hypothetical protein A2X46_19220 [Lentisphaerae bacterium GWF2_57_35]HBA85129.1 hypothetical protein [Verrucomicrobiota bacterium]